ncbi:MAG: hypothetical protein WC977_14905, partial [Anaerovoracaceae bacterium]
MVRQPKARGRRVHEGAPGEAGEVVVKHNGRCPQSPTGAHWWVMSWPEPCVYIGTCKWCGMVKHEDANLGLGHDDARTRLCGRYAARQEMAETNGDTPEEET